MERQWFFAGLAALALYGLAITLDRKARQSVGYEVSLLCLAAANLCCWFLTAPDMRFGNGFFWEWMGLCVCLVLSRTSIRPAWAYGLALLLVFHSLCALRILENRKRDGQWWRFGKAAANPTREVRIDDGRTPVLTVRVPVQADLSGDAPLPSTPYPVSTLRWRVPGRLRFGFRMSTEPVVRPPSADR